VTLSSARDLSADAVFGALADPTRRQILRAVAATGDHGITATELVVDMAVSRQAVVKHLQALAAAGLAAAERRGREQRYRATPGPLGDAVAWLVDAGAAWDARLDRLKRHVEQRPT
jgi:DNA-binding transcriptional ArsR family regulator